METFVTDLTTALAPANLWGALESAVPIIGIALLFALGYRFVKKSTKGISTGKVNF